MEFGLEILDRYVLGRHTKKMLKVFQILDEPDENEQIFVAGSGAATHPRDTPYCPLMTIHNQYKN